VSVALARTADDELPEQASQHVEMVDEDLEGDQARHRREEGLPGECRLSVEQA
jgi:hypothetical protein